MATIQVRKGKKGKTYRVEFMRDGTRHSQTFKSKKEAQKFQAELVVNSDFVAGLTNHTLNTLKLSQAVEEYSSIDTGKDTSKKQRLSYWVTLFGDKPVGKITKKEVRDTLRGMRKDKAAATCNRYKSALGALYSKFLSVEYDIEYNPVKGIAHYKEDNARTRFLSDDELSRLLIAVKKSEWNQLYLLVLMAITTGARRTEMITINWSRVDFKNKTVLLPKTKNSKQRVLTLTSEVVAELMLFRKAKGFVFPYDDNFEGYFKHFDCHWRKALKEAAIKDFKFHDLRHTCASLLAMNGASLLEIADVLGHTSLEMTKRYSHLTTTHKATLTDRVFGGLKHG